MQVYLTKIKENTIDYLKNSLKYYINRLNDEDPIYFQSLNSQPFPHSFSWLNSEDFFNWIINDVLKNKNNDADNLLIIYRIKSNYNIFNAIKVATDEYNLLQWDNKWIDTDENLTELENKLISNPEVLESAFKEYFYVTPQLHNATKKYSATTQSNYIRALEECKDELLIPIFSSFNKDKTHKYIDSLYTLIDDKDNEKVKKINNHGTLSAAVEVYNDFFYKWLSNGILNLENVNNEDIQNPSNDSNGDFPLNIILYGAPGTGKTYKTINYAVAIIDHLSLNDVKKQDRQALMKRYHELYEKGQIAFTTFHQSYTYEDFVQGLRPVLTLKNSDTNPIDESSENKISQETDGNAGSLRFELRDGIFKEIATRASKDPANNYVIIIDEINRANISRVLGELITLLEKDKRGPLWTVNLPSGDKFYVPTNLYVIGTMNTADKSISNIDVALRRRFQFIEEVVDVEKVQDGTLKSILKRINNELIESQASTDLLIGQAYFMNKTINDLPNILNQSVIPLLYEYFDDDDKKVKSIIEGLKTINNFSFEIDSNNQYGRIKVIRKN